MDYFRAHMKELEVTLYFGKKQGPNQINNGKRKSVQNN